jgi:IclR family transcriptional regulator, acetate operon repressor
MEAGRAYQSLERGLRVIEAIAELDGAATVSSIARKTGLPRSTTHHLLRALLEFGYLIQDRATRSYALSYKLFRLTGRRWTQIQLSEMAMPFLEELSRRTGEGTSLAVLRDGRVMIAAKRDSDGPVRVVQEIGADRPIYCTAVGKTLAAWLSDHELDGIIMRTVFEKQTPRTLTTAAAFRRELARVRADGFAVDNEEHVPGIRCMAAPVRDHSDAVCAALCIVGPTSRISQQRLMSMQAPLTRAAAALSAQLGHGRPDTIETNTGREGIRSRGAAAGGRPEKGGRQRSGLKRRSANP